MTPKPEQERELRIEYDLAVAPIVERLDEIRAIKRQNDHLPEELKEEKARLINQWYELCQKLYKDFLETGERG